MSANHTFFHIVLGGSPYEIGKQQGEQVRNIPGFVDFFASGRAANQRYDFSQTIRVWDRYFPGLNEEIQGFSDAVHLAPEQSIYYASTYLRAGGCSHFAVCPKATENGHTLVGRSYDFGDTMDDKRLCTTRVQGKYAHLGFSNIFFGRQDGMNEHGLSVTTSAGGIPIAEMEGLRPPLVDGFQFWATVRLILETCKNTREAIACFKEIPMCGNPIFIFADREGHICLAEAFGETRAVREIDPDSAEAVLYSSNHFVLPETSQKDPQHLKHSLNRAQTMNQTLNANAPRISVAACKTLLSSVYPQGLCTHFYKEFFGTLHALVFDLTSLEAEIAFGSPNQNQWQRFSLAGMQVGRSYPAKLPQADMPPDFWEAA